MTDIEPRQQTNVPAGWYPDIHAVGVQRWWDGNGWTQHRIATQLVPQPAVQQTVTVQEPRKRVNHLLHLILTIFTAGLWAPVWIILALANS